MKRSNSHGCIKSFISRSEFPAARRERKRKDGELLKSFICPPSVILPFPDRLKNVRLARTLLDYNDEIACGSSGQGSDARRVATLVEGYIVRLSRVCLKKRAPVEMRIRAAASFDCFVSRHLWSSLTEDPRSPRTRLSAHDVSKIMLKRIDKELRHVLYQAILICQAKYLAACFNSRFALYFFNPRARVRDVNQDENRFWNKSVLWTFKSSPSISVSFGMIYTSQIWRLRVKSPSASSTTRLTRSN